MENDSDGPLREQLVLTDLVNRVLDRGVSVVGDVLISVAGVDLVQLSLRLDLAAVETLSRRGRGPGLSPPPGEESG